MLQWATGIWIVLNNKMHGKNKQVGAGQTPIDDYCKWIFNKTSLCSHNSRAFTLIEILVVLVLISIITAVAILSFGDFGKSRQVRFFAEELTQTLQYAQHQSILQPATISFKITKKNYQFYWLKYDKKSNKFTWENIKDNRILNTRTIPAFIHLNITTKDDFPDKENSDPSIVFLPDGEISPFKIFIINGSNLAKYVVIGQTDGTIKLKLNESSSS